MIERPPLYEGSDNYIFVSYAHKDRDRVFEILSVLEQKGYRFWYDEGITPGAEWPEYIAEHLSRAYVVIAFITETSANSDNCRREITYALSKRKRFVSVILEATDISAGLELQLSAQQSVIRYNYSSYEKFIQKLLSCPDLKPCRDDSYLYETTGDVTDTDSAEESPVETTQEAAAESGLLHKTGKRARGKITLDSIVSFVRSTRGKIIIAAALLLAVTVVIIVMVCTTYISSWGTTYKKNAGVITVEGQTIRQTDLDHFAKFRSLEMIEFTDCDFSSCDPATLQNADGLFSLELYHCTGIDDYQFLNDWPLSYLSITETDDFTDISRLSYDRLLDLNISGTAVKDISALRQAGSLEHLDISATDVSDISAIKGNESLRSINISDTAVRNAGAALACPSLTSLTAGGCQIDSFDEKCKAHELEMLDVHDCGIRDLSAISECTKLKKINLRENKELKDLTWLNHKNMGTLTSIDLSKTGLDIEDFSLIEGYGKLEELKLDEVPVNNLDFCSGLLSLRKISAQGCGIEDISGLEHCTSLNDIFLAFNKISDISALKVLQKERSEEDYCDIYLDLAFNSISSVEDLLRGYYYTIILWGNDPEVVSSIPEEVRVDILCVDWYSGITETRLAGTGEITYLYISGTPQAERLKTEKAFKSTHLNMITMDEFYNSWLAEPETNGYNALHRLIDDTTLETITLYNAM